MQIDYKGTIYQDMSFVQLGDLQVAGDKVYSFTLLNRPDDKGNEYNIEAITFKTNMSKDSYSIKHPESLAKGGKGATKLTIHTEALFNDTSRDIYDQNEQHHILQMEFNYQKLRVFRWAVLF